MPNARPIRCLISAGPTREWIDPVRFITNPSSGKMGFALAEAAVERGWTVDLVSGPVALDEPDGVIRYPVETGEEMLHQCDALFDAADVLIMTAAVLDYRPSQRAPRKIKKSNVPWTLDLEPVPDILSLLAGRKQDRVCVGFAAETHSVEAYARGKLEAKNLDWIAANDVSAKGEGFGSERNRLLLLGSGGQRFDLGPGPKIDLARKLLELLGLD